MKGRRFTDSQIVSILKEHDAGEKAKDICRRHGISSSAQYNWKSKYGGMSASGLKQLKETEAELSQYKIMCAEPARENYAL
jgi:putative transposase